jgi:hypothetical protein
VNEGLVLLAAWLQWLLIVAVLTWSVLRTIEGHHPRPPVRIRRRITRGPRTVPDERPPER